MRFSLPVILLLSVYGCKAPEVPDRLLKDVDSIAFKFVPDRREGIMDLNLKFLNDRRLLIKGETNIPEAKNEIIGYIRETGLAFYDSLNIIPDPSEIIKPWGLVSVSVCNMKASPSHTSELISQSIMGTPVKILKKRGGWLLIQTPDYYIGWVNSSGITELDEKEISGWKMSDRLIYTARSGDILSEQNDSEVVSDIVSGVIVKLIAEQKDYYIVEIPDSRRGRIEKRSSCPFEKWYSEIKPEPEKLISFAKSLLGSPYLWGGTSTKMADCSGFMRTVYFTGGLILARDASQQFLYGDEIGISKSFALLQPGDLLYFGRISTGGKKIITHTGMYIGDSEVIHDSGMIKINSLDSTRSNYSSYLRESIQGARRIIGTRSAKGTEHIAQHSWYHN